MASIRFPQDMHDAPSVVGNDKIMMADAVTNNAKSVSFDEVKEYLTISNVYLDPIASGALPTPPTGQNRIMEIVGGTNGATWTHVTLPGGTVSLLANQTGTLYWSGTAWSLKNVITLPTVPVKNTAGTSVTDAISQNFATNLSLVKEDVSNKSNTIDDSTTNYPTSNAVLNYSENKENKAGVIDNSASKYPSNKAVFDYSEPKANKSNTIDSSTVNFPTNKAVFDYSEPKANKSTIVDGSVSKFPTNSAVLNYSEAKVNKTDVITSSTVNYPSSKAVLDYAENKGNKSNVINESLSNYPSNKAVSDYSEPKFNKSSVIDLSNVKFPTNKAVHDYVLSTVQGAKFGGVISPGFNFSSTTNGTWYFAKSGSYNIPTIGTVELTSDLSIITLSANGTWSYEPLDVNISLDFLVYKTMDDLRNMTPQESQLLTTGAVKGVTLLGYDEEGDTPSPINYYISDTTDIDDGGSTIAVSGIKLVSTPDNADYFGCNDKKDCTVEFTKYVNYIWKTGRRAVLLSDKQYKGDIIISDTNINVLGQSSVLEGAVKIGRANELLEFNSIIRGVEFARPILEEGNNGIEITNVRRLSIENCVFKNLDKAIYNTPQSDGFHANSQINVVSNYFIEVNYCWYIDRASGIGSSDGWMVNSDFKFIGNTSNVAYITHFYAKGVDGVEFTQNVLFFRKSDEYKFKKEYHIHIDDKSDQLIVWNNNFFESGYESIKLYNCRKLNLGGNNFAACGQRAYRSVILAEGTELNTKYIVNNNIFDKFSGSVVTFNIHGTLETMDNIVDYTDNFEAYYGEGGTAELASKLHFIVDVNNADEQGIWVNCNNNTLNLLSQAASENNFYHLRRNGKINEFKLKTRGTCESSIYKLRLQQNSDNKYILCDVSSAKFLSVYDGDIDISVRLYTDNASSNLARYSLKVSRNGTEQAYIIESNRVGRCYGKTSSQPGFYFTIEDGKLVANPIGLTSGQFYFDITTDGNLQTYISKTGELV